MRHILFYLIAICFLSGCSITSNQLRQNPDGSFNFSVQENYEVVYRRIIQQAKYCYETGERRIEANIFRDNRTAEVIVAIVGSGAVRTLFMADIFYKSFYRTQITTYYSYNIRDNWRDGALAIQKWALSEDYYCPLN